MCFFTVLSALQLCLLVSECPDISLQLYAHLEVTQAINLMGFRLPCTIQDMRTGVLNSSSSDTSPPAKKSKAGRGVKSSSKKSSVKVLPKKKPGKAPAAASSSQETSEMSGTSEYTSQVPAGSSILAQFREEDTEEDDLGWWIGLGDSLGERMRLERHLRDSFLVARHVSTLQVFINRFPRKVVSTEF
jgi:hypothetical protein